VRAQQQDVPLGSLPCDTQATERRQTLTGVQLVISITFGMPRHYEKPPTVSRDPKTPCAQGGSVQLGHETARPWSAPAIGSYMSRVTFMVRPCRVGEVDLRRRLERQGWVRLSFDVEMWRRGITTVPLSTDVHDEMEADLKRRLLELVATATTSSSTSRSGRAG